MSELPKKLQEARDAWILGFTGGKRKESIDARAAYDWCYQTLAPEIDKLVEALEKIVSPDKMPNASNVGYGLAANLISHKALAQWRTFTGDK